jgi:cell wall-associated NlpC family hydrolase
MKNCKFISLLLISFLLSTPVFGQIRDFDKIEMLYSQKHFKMVFRKSNRLLDKPDYDFSMLPTFYKSLSIFQLSQNEKWYKKHPLALEEARELFLRVQNSNDGPKIFNSHINELIYLKSDLLSWLDELKRNEKTDEYLKSKSILSGLFDKIPNIDKQGEINIKKSNKEAIDPTISKTRNDVIQFAEKLIGVPYLPAGNDPKGFDCSGFTTYVMNEFGVKLPRRAVDQEKSSKIIHQKYAKKGDLVFFDNGSGISHVGIVVSNNETTLEMIHASSSKGVIITDIKQSDYWKTRIYSFGSYLE